MLNDCLFIYLPLVKRSGEKSPLWSLLLSNLFQKFCNTDQAYYVPLTGFRINMNNILPVLLQEARKGAHFQADSQRSKAICYTWYFLTTKRKKERKDTAWDHRFPVHKCKRKLCLQKHKRRLDKMLSKTEWHVQPFYVQNLWRRTLEKLMCASFYHASKITDRIFSITGAPYFFVVVVVLFCFWHFPAWIFSKKHLCLGQVNISLQVFHQCISVLIGHVWCLLEDGWINNHKSPCRRKYDFLKKN